MSKYYKGLDFSCELQSLYDTILMVEDDVTRDILISKLEKLNATINNKSKRVKKIIGDLENL